MTRARPGLMFAAVLCTWCGGTGVAPAAPPDAADAGSTPAPPPPPDRPTLEAETFVVDGRGDPIASAMGKSFRGTDPDVTWSWSISGGVFTDGAAGSPSASAARPGVTFRAGQPDGVVHMECTARNASGSSPVAVADVFTDHAATGLMVIAGPRGQSPDYEFAWQGSAGGSGGEARFWQPGGVAVDAEGSIYVTDTGVIRELRLRDGVWRVRTIAGHADVEPDWGIFVGAPADGTGSAAGFEQPVGIASPQPGLLFVVDRNDSCVRKLVRTGDEWTVSSFGCGLLGLPQGIAAAGPHRVFVADTIAPGDATASEDNRGQLLEFDQIGDEWAATAILTGQADLLTVAALDATTLFVGVNETLARLTRASDGSWIRRTMWNGWGWGGQVAQIAPMDADTVYFAHPGWSDMSHQKSCDSAIGRTAPVGGGWEATPVAGMPPAADCALIPGRLPAMLFNPLGLARTPQGDFILTDEDSVLLLKDQ